MASVSGSSDTDYHTDGQVPLIEDFLYNDYEYSILIYKECEFAVDSLTLGRHLCESANHRHLGHNERSILEHLFIDSTAATAIGKSILPHFEITPWFPLYLD